MAESKCYNLQVMSLILIFKLVVVVIFLIIFLRRPSFPWGVGLLTVTSALLLDTILGTFNEELMRAELGFFYFAIVGFLLGGAAYWLLALLWPTLKKETNVVPAPAETPSQESLPAAPAFGQITDENGTLYDLQLIYDDMCTNFNHEDLLDLMFDLDIPEKTISNTNGSKDSIAAEIVTYAEKNEQAAQLALAVERILTPPAPETLPRLEKITPSSPRPILRYYLLAHFDLDQLQQTAVALNIDWDQIEGSTLRGKSRELLNILYQRDQIQALLASLHGVEANSTDGSDA